MASIFGELHLLSTLQKSGRYHRLRPASLSTHSFLSHSVVADATQCAGLALRFPGGLGRTKACPRDQRRTFENTARLGLLQTLVRPFYSQYAAQTLSPGRTGQLAPPVYVRTTVRSRPWEISTGNDHECGGGNRRWRNPHKPRTSRPDKRRRSKRYPLGHALLPT